MPNELEFVRTQGFRDATPESCGFQYPALVFQPRVLGVLVVIGIALRSGTYFLALSLLLAWNAARPRLNPFDALYRVLVARRTGRPTPGPAPAPRRFAQALASSLMLGIGLSLLAGYGALAVVIEVLLLAALAALIFFRTCVGSKLYLLITSPTKGEHR
jgi:hypothetical protein